MTSILTGIGLTLNIIGTLLIWRFGLPEPINKTGAIHLILEQTDEDEIRRAKRYNRFSLLGVALLVLGFLLQLVALFA
jgi:hypothetical protein